MNKTEKILLVAAVLFSWVYAFFIQYVVRLDFDVTRALLLIGLGTLVWLTPLALLTLLSRQLLRPALAFFLGSLGVLVITRREELLFMLAGIAMLLLTFIYWFLRVRYASKNQTEFSVSNMFAGMSLFFTVLAAFGGLFYYSSPDVPVKRLDPRIPEAYFDVIYTPISSIFFPGFGDNNLLDVRSEHIKPEIYKSVNLALAQGVKRYEAYIPFAFAGGVFLLLRTLFLPLSYLLFGFVSLLIQLFLYAKWLQKENIQVSKEVIRF